MNKKRKAVIAGNEISEVIELSLGGYKQKVLIEGKTMDLPIVINLHGGPGSPVPFNVGCRGIFPEFTDEFIMVYWDQYGCGINDAVISEEFGIEDYVRMTVDLVEQMKSRFPMNKLYLFAMSWGSILSLNVATRLKDKIDGVLVWGQIIKDPICNAAVFKELEKQKLPQKAMNTLQRIKQQPITPDSIKAIAMMTQKYTNGYNNKEGKKAPLGSIIFQILTSPDYNFKNFTAIMRNGSTQNRSIWKEIIKSDFSEMLCKIEVPYVIIQGDTDIVTDTDRIKTLIDQANNPNLSYRVVKHCGHMPNADGIDCVLKELLCLK